MAHGHLKELTSLSASYIMPTFASVTVWFRNGIRLPSWASAEIFPGGGQSRHFAIFLNLLTMQHKWTYTKKENVQRYCNSCIQCFLCKKTLH